MALVALAGRLAAMPRQDAADLGAPLLQDAAVKAALEAIKAAEPQTIEDQIRLCEVEAPPFKETKRGELYAQMLQRGRARRTCASTRRATCSASWPAPQPRPHLVLAAHLDTVFPEGTDVRVKREGTLLRGPGIGDDCRGLAVVLAVRAPMVKSGLKTPGTITFVGNVGEEGLGDLRGVKYLFNEGLKGRIDRFVSIDGTGLGITHIAVGSLRYRVTFKGPGGHSYGAFGMVQSDPRARPRDGDDRELRGAARSEDHLQRRPHRRRHLGQLDPVRGLDGVDMRSADAASLQSLDAKFNRAVDDAVRDENARWNKHALSVDKALVGNRPAGADAGATRRSCRRRCR